MTSLIILKSFRVYERGRVKPLLPGDILCIDKEDSKTTLRWEESSLVHLPPGTNASSNSFQDQCSRSVNLVRLRLAVVKFYLLNYFS